MSDPDTLIGQSIDHYQITRHLARGGMAALYLALDLSLKREVVLKIMLPHLSHDHNFVTRFQREARATARLNHPHIIQVYSTGFTPDGRPYLAMQYIRGGSLQERLEHLANQQQPMTTQAALTIGRQLADALHTAHQAGIVHRDLKPSNILLHPHGAPVLTDMGIAAIASDTHLTRTGDVLGTPYYMSPEQARGERPDGRADIYALGIILYELLAGKTPFQATTPLAVLHQHIYTDPPPLEQIRPDLSPATCTLVATCLQKEAGQRFQSAAELGIALDRALALENQSPTPAPILPAQAGPDPPIINPTHLLQAAGPLAPPPAAKRHWLWLLLPLILLPAVFLLMGPSLLPAIASSPTSQPTAVPATTTPALVATATITPLATSTLAPNPTATLIPSPPPTHTPAPTDTATPLSSRIAFQSNRDGDFDIYIMDLDGRNQTALTFNDVDDQYPVVAPDGQQIAFQSDRDGPSEIYIMDISGQNQQRLTGTTVNNRLPTWSPDGQQIAFISSQDGDFDIYIINSDGTGLHQLTFDDLYTGHMSWSINDEIAFNAGPEGETWDIYVISASGQDLRQLTTNDGEDWSPEWSPDGRSLLYLSMLPGNDPALFLMNADGSNQHQLYNTSSYEWGADWSADGQHIIFTSEEANISSIYIINSDGRSPQRIAERASYPSWVKE